MTNKPHYSSRLAFWLSAAGFTIGFGNVCRFPYLMMAFGGLAFLIPYVVVTCTVVLPMVVLEFGISQEVQGNCVMTSAAAGNPRIRPIGLQFVVSMALCLSYPLLLSWSLIYLWTSFSSDVPWYDENDTGVDIFSRAKDFYESPTGANVAPEYDHIVSFSWRILLAGAFAWVLGYCMVCRGPSTLVNLAYLTMTLPSACLLVLMGIGLSVDGAEIGIHNFAKLDFQKIVQPEAWIQAMGQSLFSINVAQGTLMALAMHNKPGQNVVTDSLVVVGADTAYSVISGLVSFTVCGFLSKRAGSTFDQLPLDGYGLAFQAYPAGLSTIGYPWGQLCCVLFFLSLVLLGINSLGGLLECLVEVALSSRWFKKRFPQARRPAVLAVMCGMFFTWHLVLCTSVGGHIIDALDHFNGVLLMQSFCLWEALSFGFLFLKDEVVHHVGSTAHWTLFASVSILPFTGFCIGGGASSDWKTVVNYCTWATCLAVAGISFFLVESDLSAPDRAWWLYIGNTERLRSNLNLRCCTGTIRIPLLWSLFIKFVIPVLLCFLLAQTVTSDSEMGRYGGAEGPYPHTILLIGGATSLVGLALILVGCVSPHLMVPLLPMTMDFHLLSRPMISPLESSSCSLEKNSSSCSNLIIHAGTVTCTTT
ncbi:MAG: hypothetical protein KVP17_001140 [Porospora cf. gigantea B]|uniref:uncharacterized protein n=1 Tax=Porospora cf. gigantea B TaxID=2853592 RepID=UPI0035719514|nr:MAG: hypothetical protein KVP17_001140 [Porospora cf. gigantea B]